MFTPTPHAEARLSSAATIARESCWPNELESLLLRAGLCEQPDALMAWKSFCRKVENIEELDDGCYRLFPLVAGNLRDCIADVPHAERVAGTFRYSWTKNQKLMRETVPLLRALQSAGVDLLLLKGAALTELYRVQRSVRPMADVDILIRPEDLIRAVEILRNLGCAPLRSHSREQLLDLVRFRHELTLQTGTGESLDLHWFLLSDTRHLDAEELFWQDSVPCVFGGFAGRTLHPSDQLLHTCLHGAQWNEISPVRWLADATILIRSGLEWDRLEKQGRRLERLQPVKETLQFLNVLGLDLPPGIVDHWRRLELTPFEKVEGGYRAYRPNSRQRTKQLAWGFLRLTKGLPLGKALCEVPAYMGQIHHFRSYSRRLLFLIHVIYFSFASRPGAGK